MSKADSPFVLIVDDDPSALDLMSRQLAKAGYQVLTAADGVEALRILERDGLPLIVTDWVMPNMDGPALCRAIRSHEGIAVAYVIMVTAVRTLEDELVEAFDAGADDYLCKPYGAKELIARLRAGERIVGLQQTLIQRNRQVHRYNAEIEIANRKLAVANEELNRMATTDELTGLVNRREGMARLVECWVVAERHCDPLACMTLDIDRFKCCNDAHGHAAGDAVLRQIAEVLQVQARRGDTVCRVGGEEFLVICPRSTEAMAAVGAERMREAIERHVLRYGELALQVTVSAGVAERTRVMKTPDDLLRAADRALYAAKNIGRNMVCLASDADVALTSTVPAIRT